MEQGIFDSSNWLWIFLNTPTFSLQGISMKLEPWKSKETVLIVSNSGVLNLIIGLKIRACLIQGSRAICSLAVGDIIQQLENQPIWIEHCATSNGDRIHFEEVELDISYKITPIIARFLYPRMEVRLFKIFILFSIFMLHYSPIRILKSITFVPTGNTPPLCIPHSAKWHKLLMIRIKQFLVIFYFSCLVS